MFILDNHRPLHLANIYSKHSVVVFDDTFDPSGEYDMDSLPSEGSDLSGGLSSSESEHSSEDEEEDEEMFDEVYTPALLSAFACKLFKHIVCYCRSYRKMTLMLRLVKTERKMRN